VRTREIIEGMKARTLRMPYDSAALATEVKRGIEQVVRQQAEVGIDIVNDGEYGRRSFTAYINERLGGLTPRKIDPGENVSAFPEEREEFHEFYELYEERARFLWMAREIAMTDMGGVRSGDDVFRVTGPITYIGGTGVRRDIETLRGALQGLPVTEAFITAVTPVSRKADKGVLEFYPTESAYLYALADAMHEEYKAITDSGFVLQLDYAVFNPQSQLLVGVRRRTDDDLRNARELGVELTNHALRDIPEERVRYHHCWGANNRPHTHDAPLRDFLPLMLKLNVQGYGVEGANPRHEHEWMVWQDVRLPDGKILIPGVISQSTNVVEHPELVAWRIKNFASLVGKENVIAGTDCGFSQSWDQVRVHPSIQWAKLKALVEGARLASNELWGT
jgi:5-methyltetrahydropteroyltriglutamate--homocysteine methyltransferase